MTYPIIVPVITSVGKIKHFDSILEMVSAFGLCGFFTIFVLGVAIEMQEHETSIIRFFIWIGAILLLTSLWCFFAIGFVSER